MSPQHEPHAAPPPDAPTLADARGAAEAIRAHVRRTPLVPARALSAQLGMPVHLKLESRQETGSFKLRGAVHRLLQLTAAQRGLGVVTVSTGNHGRAVAYAARALGVPATVCMSSLVPANKVQAIEALGAAVRIVGHCQDDAYGAALLLAEAEGCTLVPPFDDPAVIAGQATLGLEIAEELPEVATALVPLSGGGLIAGVGLALKGLRPGLRLVGVSMAGGAAMVESLRAGRPVQVEEQASLADSLGGGIGLDNRYTFPMVRALVDETILLSEDEIAAGMRHLHAREGLTVEGAGAVGVAALLAGKVPSPRGPVVCVVSGGNVDPTAFREVVGTAP